MRRYFEHIKTRDPHERRAHALHIATILTTLVFVGWLGTLGMRLASSGSGEEDTSSQAASVLSGFTPPSAELEVASTSYDGY